jgi:hypothetical protein
MNMTKGRRVSFEDWLNMRPEKVRGFLSVYNDEPFDYESDTPGYEVGRQLAVLAKQDGLRRSDLVRKRPKVEAYAFTKTKMGRLYQLAERAGFFNKSSEGHLFGNA